MTSNPIERILIPTDMSDFATLALDYGLLIQKKLGSEITLLYAEEFAFLLTAEYPLGYYFDNSTAAKNHAHELLRNYAKRLVPEMAHVRTLVVDDSPARAIIRTADDIRADLIIMGTHGRHGLHGTLLGSVAERVLRETGRPLMTVIPQHFPAGRGLKFDTILCPVNFTDVARQALEQACGFAQAFDARLIVVNVVESHDTAMGSVEARFGQWVDPLLRGRSQYQQVLVGGDPAARVLEVADQIGADLIVIGAQHTRFSDATVIGTTTERITRFAKQPVLTVMRKAVPTVRHAREEAAVAV
jgi:nucleotide-binding universal stress UspA family protein